MDADKDAIDADKDGNDLRTQGFTNGVMTGGIGATVLMGLASAIIWETTANPLTPLLAPMGQVNPDKLADEIAKDPKLQARLKSLRDLVDRLDQQVDSNIEYAEWSKNPSNKGQSWKGRMKKSKDSSLDRSGAE